MKRLLFFILVIITAAGCSNMNHQAGRVPVAKAGNTILYADEIPMLTYAGIAEADSVALYQSYINRWAKRELLFQKANENLGYEIRREIEKQVNETRSNLVIYQYQRQMMEQKMDTIVTESQLESYYNQNQETFLLRSTIVKAMFIKLPANIEVATQIRNLAREDDPDKVAELESLCYGYAVKYDDFNEDWITFDRLAVELPLKLADEVSFLRRTPFYEATDSLYSYFVKFRDYRLNSTVAPYEYVKNDIELILLNNRRVNYIQSLENDIYEDAVSKNNYIIY